MAAPRDATQADGARAGGGEARGRVCSRGHSTRAATSVRGAVGVRAPAGVRAAANEPEWKLILLCLLPGLLPSQVSCGAQMSCHVTTD